MRRWQHNGSLVFIFVYLMSAIAQYNDPDAHLWMFFYLAAAGLTTTSIALGPQRLACGALGTLSLMWFFWLLPEFVGSVGLAEVFESLTMQSKAVEEAREAGGALLVFAWMAVLSLVQPPRDYE